MDVTKTMIQSLKEKMMAETEDEALKTKIIRDFDKLVEIEKRFQKANRILLERLKK